MANKLKGDVTIKAGDKEYILRLDFNALCTLEEKTGKGFVAISEQLSKAETMSMVMVRACLWAGLQKHHPTMTVEEAGDLVVALGGLAGAVGAINSSMTAAFGEPEKDANPPKPEAKTGTG
jgi:hypothetical protein